MPRGLLAEDLLVVLDRAADLRGGVLGVALQMTRQLDVGHRLPGQPLVAQQRQDRVIERRGGQLDLARIGQLAVQRNDLRQQLHLLVEQPLLLLLGPVLPLLAKLGQLGNDFERERMDPHQVGPALQVENVVLREALAGPRGGVDAQAALLIQLVIARVRPDHLVRVGP